MKIKFHTFRDASAALVGVLLLSVTALVVYTQQITGTPGSPSATRTGKFRKDTFFTLGYDPRFEEARRDS